MTSQLILRFIFLLFLLPLALFCSFWTEWWIAIPVLLGCLYFVTTQPHANHLDSISWGKATIAKLLFAALVLLFSQWLVGYTGAFPQFADFSARNAQYGSLCRESWPMASAEGYPFVYYFSSWLPAALVTKLTSFELRNYNQLFFNWLLIFAAYIILCFRFKRISLLILLGMFCLATLPDMLRVLLSPVLGENFSWRFALFFDLRATAGNITTQCDHTANHGPIILLATALCLLKYKRASNYLLIGACALLYSPLGALGIFPIMLCQCLRGCTRMRVIQILRSPISYLSLAIVVITIIFYTQNSTSNTQIDWGLKYINPVVLHYFFIYWIGQSIFFLFLFYAHNKRDPIFWCSYLTFVCLPFVTYGGNYNEILFKASLPFWVCSSVFFAKLFKARLSSSPTHHFTNLHDLSVKVIAYGVVFCFCLNSIDTLHYRFRKFDLPSNIFDPYDSDFYSQKAIEVRQSKSAKRDFGGMRDLPSDPIVPYILRKSTNLP